MALGDRVRGLRIERGWTQDQLVRHARRFLGPGHLARETLSKIENGHHDPGSALLEALAQALDTSIDYLVGLTDDPGITISAMPIPELELVDLVARLNALDPAARARVAELVGDVLDLLEPSASDSGREAQLVRLLESLPADRAAYWEALIQAEADAIDRAGSRPAGSPGAQRGAG